MADQSVVWRWGPWSIERGRNGGGNPCLIVIGATSRTSHVDYPVLWPDGRIAYDRPESVPTYVKAAVAQLIYSLVLPVEAKSESRDDMITRRFGVY